MFWLWLHTVCHTSGNQIRDDGARALADALVHENCRLTCINLERELWSWWLQISPPNPIIPCPALKEDLQRHLPTRYQSRFQIFCLGRHKRAGADSPVCVLVDDVIGLIYRILTHGRMIDDVLQYVWLFILLCTFWRTQTSIFEINEIVDWQHEGPAKVVLKCMVQILLDCNDQDIMLASEPNA